MAQIQKQIYKMLDGTEEIVKICCNTSGLFYANYSKGFESCLGLEYKRTKDLTTQKELIDYITQKYTDYKNNNYTYELLITVKFACSSSYYWEVDGDTRKNFISEFLDNVKLSGFSNNDIQFDFDLYAKRNDGYTSKYCRHHPPSIKEDREITIDGFVFEKYSFTKYGFPSSSVIMPYNENIWENLLNLENGFKLLSQNLIKIIYSKDNENILSQSNIKLLSE